MKKGLEHIACHLDVAGQNRLQVKFSKPHLFCRAVDKQAGPDT
jgi:hypothetical protein